MLTDEEYNALWWATTAQYSAAANYSAVIGSFARKVLEIEAAALAREQEAQPFGRPQRKLTKFEKSLPLAVPGTGGQKVQALCESCKGKGWVEKGTPGSAQRLGRGKGTP